MLEYRLNVLDEVVDYFVIAEANQTHSGQPKKLYFEEHKDRFKKFQHKIIHLVVDLPYTAPFIDFSKGQQWENEKHQRTCLQQGLAKLPMKEQDLIILTDLDEIADPTTLRQIKEGKIKVVANQLEMSLYYYNLHTKFDAVWTHGKIFTYTYLNDSKMTLAFIRLMPCPGIPKGGWHLSYFGDERFVKNKIENFAHQEFNKPAYCDPEKIKQRMKDGQDLYGRSVALKQIAIKDNTYLPPKYEVYLAKFYECSPKMAESVLEAQYALKRDTRSDINEHLPTLRALASECRHITEAGVRTVVSSYAFATALKGKPDHTLVQVDLKKSAQVTTFQAECASEGVHTVFYEESDLSCPLVETDLFFIDTWHIYGHLKRELARWHSYAKTYIVLHDTTVDEWVGETIRNGWDAVAQSKESGIPVEEIRKGLWPAVEEFLQEHPEWHLEKRYTNNNGLTILKRRLVMQGVPEYKSAIRPSVLTDVYHAVGAFVDFLLSDESPARTLPIQIGFMEPIQSVILYNTEQLTRSTVRAGLFRIASHPNVKAVWDYSLENCKILEENGILARHVRLVSPEAYIAQIKEMREGCVYDVGFSGMTSRRRQSILEGIRSAGLSVLDAQEWGVERDKKLALCRVMLNVHYADDYKIFEQARCDVWLRAGVPVVSETSLDDDPRCINASYGALVETTVNTVNALTTRRAANDSLVLLVNGPLGANSSLSTQTVDKSRVHLVLASNTTEPVAFDGVGYASVTTYTGNIPNEFAIDVALQKGSHFCAMEGRHKLEPYVLQMLLDSKEMGVLAPMLHSGNRYSNYHTKVDANGYFVNDAMYDDLLYQRIKGQIEVPVVNGTYFVNHSLLPRIKYSDGTRRDTYVIMSDALRKQGIPQYLDNRKFHGLIMAGEQPVSKENNPKNVAFFVRHFSERGTEVAVYDYAHNNEAILKNKSIIICFTKATQQLLNFPSDRTSYEKFAKRFEVIEISDMKDMKNVIVSKKLNFFYTLTHGVFEKLYEFDNKDIWQNCKTIKHCVFQTTAPQGDYCISVSNHLNARSNTQLGVIGHIVDLPNSSENLRDELHIPKDAVVLGRHGGAHTFDIPFVQDAIRVFLQTNANTYFLFMNTKQFYEHPRILYLDKNVDVMYKTKFINTCDAMIHASALGETFGLAVAEFSSKNKPIITCPISSWDNLEHILILKEKAIIYKSKTDLMTIFENSKTLIHSREDWNAYREYTPELIMKQFDRMIFSNAPKLLTHA